MLTAWLDFAVTTAGSAAAFVFLFEGVRRWRAFGIHRTAVIMTALGALFCGGQSGVAYWKYGLMKEMAPTLQRDMFTGELPDDWAPNLDPAKRESSSLAMAKMAFVDTGRFRSYFDKSGERRTYAPTEDDIRQREFAVVTKARFDDATRNSLHDALIWLVWGLVSAAFGFGVGKDRGPLPANNTVEPDARESGARRSP